MEDQNRHGQSETAPFSESEIHAALEKILESEKFTRSKRIGDFLRFVVDEELGGRGNRLKAFSIAREVYGRDSTFDPRADSIVRVEAGRLRRLLENYYQTAGRHADIRIELPKGGYTPRFSKAKEAVPEPAPQAAERTDAKVSLGYRKRMVQVGALALVFILLLSMWLFIGDRQSAPRVSDSMSMDADRSSATFLVILPLVTINDDPLEGRLAAGLVEALVTNLAKLSGLSVMAHASLLNLPTHPESLDAIKREFGATHALRGSLELDGENVRVNVQLVEIGSSTTIWADVLDSKIEDPLVMQDLLVERVVKHLAVQVSPQERSQFKRHHSGNPEALALYRQGLILLMPPNEMNRVLTARQMFQRVIEIDPAFGGGYAGKGFSHAVTVLFLKTGNPGSELETAIRFSLQAIETDPGFGMGYVNLAFAYAMSGRQKEALFNARRAITVQPGDAFTQFVYGLCLALSGKPREAMIPMSEAIRLDPAEPRTPYRNALSITHYVVGEYAAAVRLLDENLEKGGPTGPHMEVFRAASYARLGQEDKAHSILQELDRTKSEFPMKKWLARWHLSVDDLSETVSTLNQLGFTWE